MKPWVPLVAVLLGLCVPAHAQGTNATTPMGSHLDLRQAGVVIQTDWTTCGPAAAATLLTSFFGMNATEDEIAALARPYLPEGLDPDASGYTLGSLKVALESLGLTSEGYQMDLEALVAYQERVGLPVLIHLDKPQPHFAVLVGNRAGRFLVADPSWGITVEPEAAFSTSWSGFVLVTLPPSDTVVAVLQGAESLVREYLENRPREMLTVVSLGPWSPLTLRN